MTEVVQTNTASKRGYVKQVLSGDSIILQGPATNGPPKEITIYLSNVTAPRLSKRPVNNSETFIDEVKVFFLKNLYIRHFYFFQS